MAWYQIKSASWEITSQWLIEDEESGETIAVICNDETGERARLIAAAPALLEAGKRVLEWIDSGCDPSDRSIANLRAAIAAATESD